VAEVLQPTRGLLLWRAPTSDAGGSAGARAFAALVAAGLEQVPNVAARWHGGGVNAGEGWAAVLVTGPAPALRAVSSLLSERPESVDPAHLAAAAETSQRAERGALAEARSRVATAADLSARAAVGDALPEVGDAAQARRVAASLAARRASWHPLP
jgi:hypothetical protein